MTPDRLADNLKVSLNRLSYESLAAVVVESLVLGSLPDESGRVEYPPAISGS